MADCIPIGPINPFNQAILSAFGPNFYPPFNAGFQPVDKKSMANEKLLQMQLPGGGKIKPTGQPYTSINELLTTVMGAIGSIMSGFAPIFIILDLIRGILDIICALFNPIPVIQSIVDLFLNVIPPVIAILPPIASILFAIDVIKLIIAVIMAMLSSLIPIIEQILECGTKIPADIENGNFSAVDGCAQRICQLLQLFLNEIGALAPISLILEMLDFMMGLGANFFCAAEAECCNPDSCPPIINDPPTGSATILSSQGEVNLQPFIGIDLVIVPAATVLSAPMNPEVIDLKPYIIDPAKLKPTTEDTALNREPATIRASIGGALYPVVDVGIGTVTIRASGFTINDVVDFEIVPDKTQLLLSNLISLGCIDDIVAAQVAASNNANNDSGGARRALEPLVSKVGRIPRPDALEEALLAIHDILSADPTQDVTADVNDAISDYLSDLTSFYEDVVCAGASKTASAFEVSKIYAVADGSDSAQLSLRVNERSGANLIDAQLPNTNFQVIFTSTLGTVGPVIFDPADSTYKASFVSNTAGTAAITASFLVKNQECISPGAFNGSDIVGKVLNVEFVPPAGRYPRRRRERQYQQSSGGRRRP
jgi:hypothetical protein